MTLDDIETVTPGEGMPCIVCVINHVTGTAPSGQPPAGSADAAGLAAGGIAYQEWGWPVTRHRDQVRLSLHRDVSALAIPIPLSTEVTQDPHRPTLHPAGTGPSLRSRTSPHAHRGTLRRDAALA